MRRQRSSPPRLRFPPHTPVEKRHLKVHLICVKTSSVHDWNEKINRRKLGKQIDSTSTCGSRRLQRTTGRHLISKLGVVKNNMVLSKLLCITVIKYLCVTEATRSGAKFRGTSSAIRSINSDMSSLSKRKEDAHSAAHKLGTNCI